MNCCRFQNRLHEYLDGDLSRWGKAAAEKHLARCDSCRRALQQEQQFARSLSQELDHAAESLRLSANFRDRLAETLASGAFETASARERSWLRLTSDWAPSAAAAIVIALMGVLFFFSQPPKTTSIRLPELKNSISLQVSYAVPTYTFHKEDGLVVDALSYHTNVVTETLWVENHKSVEPQIPL
jgi:predicted anti-sigma-YlaC factor YlaD